MKRVKSGIVSFVVAIIMLLLAYSKELSVISGVIVYMVALIILGVSLLLIATNIVNWIERKQKEEKKRVKESREYKYKNAIQHKEVIYMNWPDIANTAIKGILILFVILFFIFAGGNGGTKKQ